MKKFLVSLCLLTASVAAMAQIDDDDKQLFNHVGLSAGVGLDGISIEAATTICPYVQMRAGVALFPSIKVKGIDVNISGGRSVYEDIKNHNDEIKQYGLLDAQNQKVVDEIIGKGYPENLTLDAKLNMTNFKMLFDIYPTKTSPWRLTVGFYAGKSQLIDCYTTNCSDQLKALTDYNETLADRTFTHNGHSYTFPEEIGVKLGDYLVKPNGPQATAFLKVNGFKPYIGIGSGRAISNKHRFSFAWDLGCQFWGTPTIFVQDKEISKSENLDGDGGIVKTVSKISVYPTLSFRINGRIL